VAIVELSYAKILMKGRFPISFFNVQPVDCSMIHRKRKREN
jgi:hypothetical protein